VAGGTLCGQELPAQSCHGLEIGPELRSPLIHEVRFVDHEVAKVTCSGGIKQGVRYRTSDRLGRDEEDGLRTVPDPTSNRLPLVIRRRTSEGEDGLWIIEKFSYPPLLIKS
jgi:hypothetical protein